MVGDAALGLGLHKAFGGRFSDIAPENSFNAPNPVRTFLLDEAGTVPLSSEAQEALLAERAALTAPARTFTSSDPLVADIANAIEARYPGHVIDINVTQGGLEIDILTRNAIIEVKQGGAGLTRQVTARLSGPANPENLAVIGYSPQLGRHATNGINNAGGIGTNDLATLLDVIRP